jgi:hypothetical protein
VSLRSNVVTVVCSVQVHIGKTTLKHHRHHLAAHPPSSTIKPQQ